MFAVASNRSEAGKDHRPYATLPNGPGNPKDRTAIEAVEVKQDLEVKHGLEVQHGYEVQQGYEIKSGHKIRDGEPLQTPRLAPIVGFRASLTPTPLGQMLIARTEQGICALALGKDREALLAGLNPRTREQVVEHWAATSSAGDEQEQALAQFIAASAQQNPAALLTLPLDLTGTDFQKRVWRALRQIPAGQTRSYRALALAIGNPRAVRAVARACATNPVALLIPCHRVIGSSGQLTGYRWGLELKQTLLAIECPHKSSAETMPR